MSKPQTALKTFDDMEAAFRYCRDRNCPVTVIVAGDLWRLYPSGKATPLQRVKDGCA